MQQDERLAYRLRPAETADDAGLRAAIGAVLAHPDKPSSRGRYRGAVDRGDLLVLEKFDRQEKVWSVAGFVEFHMRVDDTLTIRDLGNAGDTPQPAVVRYLLDELFRSFKPAAAQAKVRADAGEWQDIFRAIPGFFTDGQEYRRPHYWTIWRWEPQRAREEARANQQGRGNTNRPQPPTPPPPPMQRPPFGRPGGPDRFDGPRPARPSGDPGGGGGNRPGFGGPARDPRDSRPPFGGPQRGPRPGERGPGGPRRDGPPNDNRSR